jgi:hypothetical protein
MHYLIKLIINDYELEINLINIISSLINSNK